MHVRNLSFSNRTFTYHFHLGRDTISLRRASQGTRKYHKWLPPPFRHGSWRRVPASPLGWRTTRNCVTAHQSRNERDAWNWSDRNFGECRHQFEVENLWIGFKLCANYDSDHLWLIRNKNTHCHICTPHLVLERKYVLLFQWQTKCVPFACGYSGPSKTEHAFLGQRKSKPHISFFHTSGSWCHFIRARAIKTCKECNSSFISERSHKTVCTGKNIVCIYLSVDCEEVPQKITLSRVDGLFDCIHCEVFSIWHVLRRWIVVSITPTFAKYFTTSC